MFRAPWRLIFRRLRGPARRKVGPCGNLVGRASAFQVIRPGRDVDSPAILLCALTCWLLLCGARRRSKKQFDGASVASTADKCGCCLAGLSKGLMGAYVALVGADVACACGRFWKYYTQPITARTLPICSDRDRPADYVRSGPPCRLRGGRAAGSRLQAS